MSNSGPVCFHIGDFGINVIVDFGENVSAATSCKFYITKPLGSKATWTAALEGTTRFKYVTVSGDFNEVGDYVLQAKLVMPTWTAWSSTDTFTIEPNIDV
jgi:hypothetical protein